MLSRKRTVFIAVIILLELLLSNNALATPDTLPKITVEYYYNNPCSSCNEEAVFAEKFDALVGDAKDGVKVEFLYYNIFRAADHKKFEDACDLYGIPNDKTTTLPVVFISGKPLIGTEEIDSKLAEIFVAEKQRMIRKTAGKSQTVSKPIYFFVSPCEDCAAVKEFMDKLPASYSINYNEQQLDSQLFIESYNVADLGNLELIQAYFQSYHVPEHKQKVPILFLRDGYLGGRDEIINGLEDAITSGRGIGITPPGGKTKLELYEWPGIFLTGLVNGFNPCSVSMLLFLVTLLLARKANVLKLGSLFILGKFIAYLVLGTLLFNVLAAIDSHVIKFFTDIVKYLLLIAVIIVAAVNVSDFIAAKNEKYGKIRMQLPAGLRKLNHKWIKSMEQLDGGLLPIMTFVLGMAISVGEFLCTGQIYLATILYLMKRSPELNLQTMGAFLVYVMGMLLPLITITFAIHKGREVFNVSELARKNMPAIKLINAVVFAVFAILILLFF